MANDQQGFRSTVETLLQGMDGFLSTKTVIGDAIHIGETIILPLVDVTFGIGAGAFNKDAKNQGGGGMGGKMSPCAVLVITNGTTRLINIKDQTSFDKVIDMVPDFVGKFRRSDKNADHQAYERASKAMEETIVEAANPND